MNIEGLVFETRADDKPFIRDELDRVITEQTWSHPEDFGHIESTVKNHIAELTRRSIEDDLITKYPEEIRALGSRLAGLQETVRMDYETFKRICCPEDLGINQSFSDRLFDSKNSDHEPHPGHEDHDHDDDDEWEIGPNGKRRRRIRKRVGSLALAA